MLPFLGLFSYFFRRKCDRTDFQARKDGNDQKTLKRQKNCSAVIENGIEKEMDKLKKEINQIKTHFKDSQGGKLVISQKTTIGDMCLESKKQKKIQDFLQYISNREECDCRSSYDECLFTAEWLMARTSVRPLVGIVCGPGLGKLPNMMKNQVAFNYSDIPNFPQRKGNSRPGRLVFGTLKNRACVCMLGRFHLYEGYPIQKATMPIRIFELLGVETVILTNTAGGLNQDFSVGDIMIIKDHINMPESASGNNLSGSKDERFVKRLSCMLQAYDRKLQQLANDVGIELGYEDFLKEGVFYMLRGPSVLTIAECRMLHGLGANAVGMSTVPEVIVARHCGMRVFALSLITNRAVMDYNSKKTPHEEVFQTTRRRVKQLERLVSTIVARLEHRNH